MQVLGDSESYGSTCSTTDGRLLAMKEQLHLAVLFSGSNHPVSITWIEATNDITSYGKRNLGEYCRGY